MSELRIQQVREQKDQFFKSHPQSPLTPHQQQQFNKLEYFDYNPKLDLTVDVKVFDEQHNMQVQTTTGEARWYLRYGEFTFRIGLNKVRLTIYKTPPDNYFLPFVDSLAGEETYPAGRYLEPVALPDGQFRIDFNQAYNPYCAYSAGWTCPITPAENRIKVAIKAGEKMPKGDWVHQA